MDVLISFSSEPYGMSFDSFDGFRDGVTLPEIFLAFVIVSKNKEFLFVVKF